MCIIIFVSGLWTYCDGTPIDFDAPQEEIVQTYTDPHQELLPENDSVPLLVLPEPETDESVE